VAPRAPALAESRAAATTLQGFTGGTGAMPGIYGCEEAPPKYGALNGLTMFDSSHDGSMVLGYMLT
jgi:hypothetical protein